MLDSWIIAALSVIIHFLMERSISMYRIWGSIFLMFSIKSNLKGGIWYLCSHHPTPIWRIFFSYSKKISVFQPCAFNVILLILCLSLVIYNIPIKSILLRFRSGIYLLMNVFLSISDQLGCKSNFSLWFHLNSITACVNITNL